MGLPAIASVNQYGGLLRNARAVANPLTERDAAQANKAYADCAMMTHTAVRAWALVTTAATTGAMVLVAHDAVWGNSLAVVPTLARVGSGSFTLTYPTSVTAEDGTTQTVSFRASDARPTDAFFLTQSAPSSNVVSFKVADTSGVANDAAGKSFLILAL